MHFYQIKLELKKNILNFGHGINYKYDGMLAHSFDRFYAVTKFISPSIGDMNFSKLNYDDTCFLCNKNIHNADTKKHMLDLIMFCKKIKPFVIYYKRLIKSYNNTTHNILKMKELILPQVPRKQKCGIITTLESNFIGLAYPVQQIGTIRKCDTYVWHLQCRNSRKTHWYSTPNT